MDNNTARKIFKEFVNDWGLERSGSRSVFKDSGKLWAFVADSTATGLRQFYEDCCGVYKGGEFIPKDELCFGPVSRISPSGLKAYSVKFVS